MTAREKYIKVLSKTVKTVKEYNEDAPIKISLECVEDILELLKEQEDLGAELTNAVELIHKKNNRIEELLKEQEHSETFIVIDNKTGEEADTYDIALHEDWAKHLCYCDMEGWAIEEDGALLLVDECGRFAYADRERFKVKWE